MTIRVGIIGASFARAAYLPALRTIDDVELVAIASARLVSAQSAADQFAIPQVYDDWRRMIGEQQFDLVCIATPTVFHAPMSLAALKAGAHVLCEKPMAMNQDGSAAMLETAEAAGLLHIIGHELRFNPNRRKIKSLINSEAIGEVRYLNIHNVSPTWGDPTWRRAGDWLLREDMGGGRLGASGSHMIDLLRFWLGDIGAVSGQVATMSPERFDRETGARWIATADDHFSFTAEMRNGALCTVTVSFSGRHGQRQSYADIRRRRHNHAGGKRREAAGRAGWRGNARHECARSQYRPAGHRNRDMECFLRRSDAGVDGGDSREAPAGLGRDIFRWPSMSNRVGRAAPEQPRAALGGAVTAQPVVMPEML